MNYPITYARNREDLIIAGILKSVRNGFYVDIGAGDPDYSSVTKRLYMSGWHGINIESARDDFIKLEMRRIRDTNVIAKLGRPSGSSITPSDLRSLESILDQQHVKHIDVMRINAGGNELDVISTNNWTKYRPTLLCVSASDSSKNRQTILAKHGYTLFFFDGLNEYFVTEKSQFLVDEFSYSESVLAQDYISLPQHETMVVYKEEVHRLNQELSSLHYHIAALNAHVSDLGGEVGRARRRVDELEYHVGQSRLLRNSFNAFMRSLDVAARANIVRLQTKFIVEKKYPHTNNEPNNLLHILPNNKKRLNTLIRFYDFETNLKNAASTEIDNDIHTINMEKIYLFITRRFFHLVGYARALAKKENKQ